MIIKNNSIIYVYDKGKVSLEKGTIDRYEINKFNGLVDLYLRISDKIKLFAFEKNFGSCLYLSKKDFELGIKYNVDIKNGNLICNPISLDYINKEINRSILKDNEFSEREKIHRFCKMRDIKYLYHFTNIENIESIIKNGLLPVEVLERKKIKYKSNDKNRRDQMKDAISLSISFPNTRYLKNCEANGNRMCIIELDVILLEILYKYAYYSKYNAARTDTTILNDIRGLCKMYASKYRNQNIFEANILDRPINLPLKYPTQDQAELLIKHVIDTIFIKRIIFKNKLDLDMCKDVLNKYQYDYCINEDLFMNRNEYLTKKY